MRAQGGGTHTKSKLEPMRAIGRYYFLAIFHAKLLEKIDLSAIINVIYICR